MFFIFLKDSSNFPMIFLLKMMAPPTKQKYKSKQDKRLFTLIAIMIGYYFFSGVASRGESFQLNFPLLSSFLESQKHSKFFGIQSLASSLKLFPKSFRHFEVC